MAYLDIFGEIANFLKKNNLFESIEIGFHDLFGLTISKDSEINMYYSLVLEFGLFKYVYNSKLLIDYVFESLKNDLDSDLLSELDLIKNSQRRVYKIISKQKFKTSRSRGKKTWLYEFLDIGSKKIYKVSGTFNHTPSDLKYSARLIFDIDYPQQYLTLGLMCNSILGFEFTSLEDLESFSPSNLEFEEFSDPYIDLDVLFKNVKKLTLDEIKNYDNLNSHNVVLDSNIMLIAKQFYDKWGIGLEDFNNDLINYIENHENLYAICIDYITSLSFLMQVLDKCDYSYDFEFMCHLEILKSYFGFLLDDTSLFFEGLKEYEVLAWKNYDTLAETVFPKKREKKIEFHKKNLLNFIETHKDSYKNLPSMDILELTKTATEKDLESYVENIKKFYILNKFLLNDEDFNSIMDSLEYISIPNNPSKEVLKTIGDSFDPSIHFNLYFSGEDEFKEILLPIFYSYKYYLESDYKQAYERIVSIPVTFKYASSKILFYLGKVNKMFNNQKYKKYFLASKKYNKTQYKQYLKDFLDANES